MYKSLFYPKIEIRPALFYLTNNFELFLEIEPTIVYISGMEEKRKSPRAACDLPASFHRSPAVQPRLFEVLVDDISEGGVCFHSSEFLGLQEKVLLKLNLPKRQPIEVMAQPAWTREAPSINRFKTGLRFLSIGEEDRQTLRNFVSVSLALERLQSFHS